MNYRTVLFDLDGTLLNTLDDIADSTRRVLRSFGLPERTTDEVRCFVGNGIRKLIERAVPSGTSEEIILKVLEAFKVDYSLHSADKTAPYPGILPLLSDLKAHGIRAAVISNKADFAVKSLSERYFRDLLDEALGETPEFPKKPAPDMLYSVMEHLLAVRENTVYIGDSDVDFETAQNAGLDLILVDWGFRDTALLNALAEQKKPGTRVTVVSSVEELKTLLLS